MNGTENDKKKALRVAKATRHLYELELHTIMQIDMNVTAMRVIGGWIYFHRTGDGSAAVFVPEKR